jgi:hypothetical protein
MTGERIPHPHAWSGPLKSAAHPFTGEEIVHSRRKRRGKVNPLVVGSNPTGPKPTLDSPAMDRPGQASGGAKPCRSGTFIAELGRQGRRRALGLQDA